jgi:predicted metal-binding membrane protein
MISRAWADNRPGFLTLSLLLLVTIAAWAGVIRQATSMSMSAPAAHAAHAAHAAMSADMSPAITPAGLVTFVLAWVVMMAAMMLPSAAPMILLYRSAARTRAAQGNPFVPTWIFVLGYLVVWAAFGVVVYLAGQLVSAELGGNARLAAWTPYGIAAILFAAGAFQFTPLKRVCLHTCRSPLGFLLSHWRPGPAGAFRMGLDHGAYCTGCCWALMAVLVAAGAMGLPWVLLIALAVAAEKLLPRGHWAAWIIGAMLLGLGILVAVQPHLALALRGQGM